MSSSNEPTGVYAGIFIATLLAVGVVLMTAQGEKRDEDAAQAAIVSQIELQTAGADRAVDVALKCEGVTGDPAGIDPKTCEPLAVLTGPPVRSLARPGHCDEIISDNAPPRIECAPARTAASMPRPGHCDEIINDAGDRWIECG